MVNELERSYFRGCFLNSFANLWVLRLVSVTALSDLLLVRTETEFHVYCCGSTLENTESAYNWRGHPVLRLVDLEVLQRSFRLGPPILVSWDLNLAKGIAFCSVGGSHGGRAGKGSSGKRGWGKGLEGLKRSESRGSRR